MRPLPEIPVLTFVRVSHENNYIPIGYKNLLKYFLSCDLRHEPHMPGSRNSKLGLRLEALKPLPDACARIEHFAAHLDERWALLSGAPPGERDHRHLKLAGEFAGRVTVIQDPAGAE
jgi:hypothetical protein